LLHEIGAWLITFSHDDLYRHDKCKSMTDRGPMRKLDPLAVKHEYDKINRKYFVRLDCKSIEGIKVGITISTISKLITYS